MKNVEMKCADCCKEQYQDWHIENKGKKIVVGDYIKVACKDGKETEHMWFEVIEVISDIEFKGRLDNMPVMIGNLKYRDIIKIKFNQIEDLWEDENKN